MAYSRNLIAVGYVLVTLLLSSCDSLRHLVRPTKPAPVVDTVYMQVTTGGFEEVPRSTSARTAKLRGPGSSTTFRLGDPVALVLEGVNQDSHAIETSLDDESGMVTMRVLSKRDGTVYVTKKCQTFVYSSLTDLPKITVASGLDPEQIIVTPLCDRYGDLYGYELRYGSVERGCNQNARRGLLQFSKCGGTSTAKPGVKRNKVVFGRYFGL